VLTAVLAHGAGNVDPALAAAAVIGPALAYGLGASRRRGGRPGRRRRDAAFAGGLAAAGAAIAPPLDLLAAGSVSAHMVQHLLLLAVAAPLLAASAPVATFLRGLPGPARALARRTRRAWFVRSLAAVGRQPVAVAAVHGAVLWAWHAPVPYEAALDDRALHVLAHATFLATAIAAWVVILRSPPAGGLLALFALSLQSSLLAALLTFSPRPWYATYTLSDQQVAGVLMWVPAGLVHLGAGLWLLRTWLADERPGGARPVLGDL
jgi:cytochrome c oxidase assembly factor CtaG